MSQNNLNTLPLEVIMIIFTVLQAFADVGSISLERNKTFCGYSRICPSFKTLAQKEAYSFLIFSTDDQIEDWLESDTTIAGLYSTIQLFIEADINQATLQRLLISMNQGDKNESLTSLQLKLVDAIPSTLFQNSKLKGLTNLSIDSAVSTVGLDVASLPFQIKQLILDQGFTAPRAFINHLFTPSLSFLIFNARDRDTQNSISNSLHLATSLKRLETFVGMIAVEDVPTLAPIEYIHLTSRIELPYLSHLLSTLFALNSVDPSIKNLSFYLITPTDNLEADSLDTVQAILEKILPLACLRKLEHLTIQHDRLFTEELQGKLIAIGKKRNINVVYLSAEAEEDEEEDVDDE